MITRHSHRIGLGVLAAIFAFLFVNVAASRLADVPDHALYAAPPAQMTAVVLPSVAAVTPNPTATLVPDTTVVISTDFTTCNTIETPRVSSRCEDGKNILRLEQSGITGWVRYPNAYADTLVEVTAGARTDALTRYGVILRAADDDSAYYLVGLQNDGKYAVFYYNRGYTPLVPWFALDFIRTGAAANQLRVINQGSQIAVYVNGEWLATLKDERLKQGRVGLFVEGSQPGVEAVYDDLRVSKINRPLEIPEPENAPTPTVPSATQTPPPPAPTPTPTPGETTLLADINYAKCTPIENERIYARCEDGEFVFTKRGENFFEWLAYAFNLTNAIYEVETRVYASAPDLAYGLLVRFNAENAGYLFALNPDGEYGLWRLDNQDFEELVPFTYSDAITDGANRLKVIAQDDQLALYINDEFVELVGGVASEPGRVALYLESDEPNVTVGFDNLRVAQINRPLALGEPEDELCELNEGEAGILLNNGFDAPMTFTIGGGGWGTHEYEIPGGGEWYIISMPPGRYTFTAFIPGVGTAHGERFDYQAGVCRRISFAP